MLRYILLLCLVPFLTYADDDNILSSSPGMTGRDVGMTLEEADAGEGGIRAHKLYDSVRCPTCVAQSIKESDTIASGQIREFIDHRVARGDTDDEILAELQRYYGPGITFKPWVGLHTIMLWLLPLGFLVFAVYRLMRR